MRPGARAGLARSGCRRGLGAMIGAVLIASVGAVIAAPAKADENSDLNLIPKSIDQNAPPEATGQPGVAPVPTATAQGKFYIENALTGWVLRGGLTVPLPPTSLPDWQNRTSFDATDQWTLAEHLTASLGDRVNLVEQSNTDFPSHQNLGNDFREGFLTWEPLERAYLELGRINVRNGIALGFNPTDFFKTRSLVDQVSQDPSVIRQDRLGVFMIRGQYIWNGGSASVAIAPQLRSPSPVTITTQPTFNPLFGQTNGADRFLATVSYDIEDLSPQALIYHERDQTKFGLNLSRGIGQSIVAYAEWAGGREPSLIAQAIAFGKETATLPSIAPILPPSDSTDNFRNDLAIGASWTSTAKITINLEYHYHQAGFSRQDWHNWFDIGAANPTSTPVVGELWYIRAYANDQQEPLTRHQVFMRADWTDAFVTNLELSAFAFVNLYDASSLAQVAANYYLSDAWTLGAYATGNLGGARTERGSFPQAVSGIIQLVRYF